MKKIIVIFLILASVFSFITVYNQTNVDELEKVEKVEEGIAKQFVIPNNLMIADADVMYPILVEAAIESNVNIFRTNVNYKANDRVEIVKYVLLTSETALFDAFKLNSGRFFSTEDTQQSELFISTANTDDKNQVGVIGDFGDNDLITIKPLKISYEYLPIDGQYFAEVADDQEFSAFMEGFVDKVNNYYKKYNQTLYTLADFEQNPSISDMGYKSTSSVSILKYINYTIFVIVLILLIYYIFNDAKRMGIMKMHGVSHIRLWFIIFGKLITMIFVLAAIVSLLLAILVKNTTAEFVYNVFTYQFKTYIIIMAISVISHVYISRIKINDIVKNRKDTKDIFVLNMLFKVGCSILLVLTCLSIWNQYIEIGKKQENLKNWEHSKDYGIYYPINTGYDQEDMQSGAHVFISTINGELYPVLNKMGAILINAGSYEERQLRLNKDYNGIRSITVNNNYLQEFPVYDIDNNTVQVPEDTNNWILLVPEKYRNQEKDILSYFEKDRVSARDYEKNFLSKQFRII